MSSKRFDINSIYADKIKYVAGIEVRMFGVVDFTQLSLLYSGYYITGNISI